MWSHCWRAFTASLDLFLPPVCLLCARHLRDSGRPYAFCPACTDAIEPLPAAHCRCCKHPYPDATSCHLCPGCLTRPPHFTTAYAAGRYRGPLKAAIHKLKYRQQLFLAKPLGELLARSLADDLSAFRPDVLLPVPIHRQRLRRRGYNQALEIARPIARFTRVPIEAGLLLRIRPTPSQQGLPAQARRNNLREAFRVRGAVAGARILLVDDVMTTGETVRACSRELVQAGATDVRVAVVGRA